MLDSVVLVGGGLLQRPAVEEVKRLGYYCIVTDASLDCLALGDRNYACDIYDVEAHLSLIRSLRKELNILSVFTQGHDVEVTVAACAEELGLPTCGVKAALRCKNKARMRWRLDSIPHYNCRWRREVGACDHSIWEIPMPCVVKPVDNSASRGVSIVHTQAVLIPAIRRAQAASSTGTCIIEDHLTGPEQTVEILTDCQGQVHRINITDRAFNFTGDRCIETSISTPTRLDSRTQEKLWSMMVSAAKCLGVGQGVFKCDSIVTEDGPKILECTARLSGGYDAQYLQPAAFGTNPVRAALLVSLGEPVEGLEHQFEKSAVCYSVLYPPLRKDFLPRPGVEHVFIRSMKPHPLEDCASRYAFIITSANNLDQAYTLAREVEQDLIAPAPSL